MRNSLLPPPGFSDISTNLLEDLRHVLAEVALCCPLLVLYQGSNSNTVELVNSERLDMQLTFVTYLLLSESFSNDQFTS